MDDIDSIGEFYRTKQLAFNEACCGFASSENMTSLAEKIGINPTMLRNKLNPEQPHVLNCVELVTLTKASDNHTVLNSLLLGLEVLTAHIPANTVEDTLVKCALENAIHSGELSRMVLESAGKHRLTRAEKYQIVQTAHANISNHVRLIKSLEKLNRGASMFITSDREAVGSGALVSLISPEA
ncbi:phage regulatory CII family protein [Vibrio tapetis]|uniref:phage regulatory CII family protein n=1 Tax=Vibrio tapetis TaxID=52443 RepID=UPI000C82F058|nr:phage regulatory CII family protein [Vibrio tapetis]